MKTPRVFQIVADEYAALLHGATLLYINLEESARWRGPVVYMALKQGRPKYVGLSSRGLERVMSSGHAQFKKIGACELGLWFVQDLPTARHLEYLLIQRFQPPLNVALRKRQLRFGGFKELVNDPLPPVTHIVSAPVIEPEVVAAPVPLTPRQIMLSPELRALRRQRRRARPKPRWQVQA